MKYTLATIFLLLTGPVFAACYPLEPTLDVLRTKHGESLAMIAQSADGNFVQFWANQETQTWTILEVSGEVACVRASGTAYTIVEPERPPNL